MSETITKGYKAFDTAGDGGLMCRTMRYEVGGEYELNATPVMCERGYHFCQRLADCFAFYGREARICEVEAWGTVVAGDDGKSVADHIRIVRELDRHEVLDLANAGRDCTGIRNSGDRNSGDRNSGNRNSGYGNSGYRNSGDSNSGDWNSGDGNSGDGNSGIRNSGDWNIGYYNSGNLNSGSRNSGDWNATNFSAGVLCTEEPECLIFDRPSGMTLREWRDSEAAYLMLDINIDADRWIDLSSMTDEERAAHPGCETTGGYLHVGTGRPDFAGWWDGLTSDERAVIMAIPNFDAAKWKKITGIDVAGDAR